MLIRHDPFNRLDRMADELWRRMAAGPAAGSLQVHRDADGVEITLDLPGVEPDGIEVTVERNLLTIRAERRARGRSAMGAEVKRSETFTREVLLGDSLDSDGARAHFEHGVLTIEVPARTDVHPRRLDVGGRGGSTPIPTASSSSAGPGEGRATPADAAVGAEDEATAAAAMGVFDVGVPDETPTEPSQSSEPAQDAPAKTTAAKQAAPKKTAAKKAPAKKAAAKKSAGKKTAAKKTAAKKDG